MLLAKPLGEHLVLLHHSLNGSISKKLNSVSWKYCMYSISASEIYTWSAIHAVITQLQCHFHNLNMDYHF